MSFTPIDTMSLKQLYNALKRMKLPELVDMFNRLEKRDFPDAYSVQRHEGMHKLLTDWDDILATAAGSSANHQAWPGGLKDHVAMILRDAVPNYLLCRLRWQDNGIKPPFGWQSLALTILAHDAEKLIKYAPEGHIHRKAILANYHASYDPHCQSWPEHTKWEMIKLLVLQNWQSAYGLTLTDYELNAVKYAHGEGDDYLKNARVANELTALLHALDHISARIGHNADQGLG